MRKRSDVRKRQLSQVLAHHVRNFASLNICDPDAHAQSNRDAWA